MNLGMILEMAADGFGDRTAYGSHGQGVTYEQLLDLARQSAARFTASGAERVAFVGSNSLAVPVALLGAGLAGLPYVPLNYRLADDALRALLRQIEPAAVIVDRDVRGRLGDGAHDVVDGDDVARGANGASESDELPFVDPEAIALLLYTSGTTGTPKAAVLRHRHLVSYIFGSVEFGGAQPDEATLVSVPPYHIAGVAALLSAIYSGRRVVHLRSFEPHAWIETARTERITHAMMVPTMLARVVDVLRSDSAGLPALRSISYGGGKMPLPVIDRALTLLPHVSFVNAYGLTETSSTIALLGPDDHRAAHQSDDPTVRRRLGSVGRPLPSVEIEIRDEDGRRVETGTSGELWVRGEQISGEYVGMAKAGVDHEGWFATKDGAFVDDGGYLFVEGRLDDVIVRGGENLSPGEIEDVLLEHDGVVEAAVVGAADEEWGEKVVAFVVAAAGASLTPAEIQEWVRARLRSTRVPEDVIFTDELPYNETGKLLRRQLRARLADASRSGVG
jgi:acyl-CoA synthetase (AMP-forming)/AMP-acid ligase II